ncbi:MAG: T9SS type A sorting domain-containing protein [Saprospiraceae bacterium]|nr:T9SS type A sorting domain-containing protein [Saprospiraceae bacterium]
MTYGSNGKKIYKTIDGGVSWINLTTAVLNDVRISDILHAYGTDGGIYLGTHRGVFYRNNVMSDWFPYSKGLPFSAETNRLKPFYKEGKLRNGCWGFGVWEIDLFESSRTLPKIMADKLRSACLRDTFYFDDYSVLHHANTQWMWNFEDVAYQSGMDTRTPKVVFKSPGLKKIKMQIDNPSGVFTDSLYVEVGSACEKDSLPGYALELDGVAAHAQIPALDVSTNNISFMAWVKSTSVQKNWAGILFSRDNSQAAGLSVLSNGELRYHWNSGGYNWSSQARLDQNEWTHVAMVVEPGSVTIYKNGTAYKHVTTVNEHTFVSPFAIGADLNGTDRYFNGQIDEVCFYDRALSQSEIREIMHLTRTHTQESGLKRYYQFNENEGLVLDRQGVSHVSLNATAQRLPSTAPVGPGRSQRLDIRSRGVYTFDKTGVEITTEDGGVFPNGELCLSRINYIPENNFDPNGNPTSPSYWILHNYGAQKSFSSFKSMKFDSIGFISNASPISDYALYKRNPNADTASWNFSSQASLLFPSSNGNVVFEPSRVQEEGQFLLTKSAHDTVIVSTTQKGSPSKEYFIMIYPNPSLGNQKCTLHSNIAQPVRFKLLDNNGRVLIRKTFSGHSEFELTDLPVGSYHCIFETDQKLSFLKLMVTK